MAIRKSSADNTAAVNVSLHCAYELIPDLQANKAHPYYRYGYSLALGVGIVAAAYAMLRDPAKPQTEKGQK